MVKATLRGVVRGKCIELEGETPFSDGEPVMVEVYRKLVPGDGIRASAGAWADAGDDLDHWLDDVYRARHSGRSMDQS